MARGKGGTPATVVFDVRANHDTGVSRYGLSLLAAAAPLAVDTGWRLIVVAHPFQDRRARAAVAGLDAEVLACCEGEGFVRRSPWLRRFLIQQAADLYFTSHYTVDRRCPVPFVFTIHDLTRLRFPDLSYNDESFARRFGTVELNLVRDELTQLAVWDQPRADEAVFTRYFRALNRYLVQRAERVVTVSRSTARDIETMLQVDPARLALVPCGVDTDVFHRRHEAATRAVRHQFGLNGPYLMFVGLTHPNKRFPWLVEQLVHARRRFPADARLVAVGDHAGNVAEVAHLLASAGWEDFVTFTGRVNDADLACLYSGAAALVTASLNEGNNLPPLETLACGSHVIATDIPPLRETLGEAASFYSPTAGDELAALAEAALTGRLPESTRPYQPPLWADAARKLVDVLSDAIRGGRTRHRADQARRMRA